MATFEDAMKYIARTSYEDPIKKVGNTGWTEGMTLELYIPKPKEVIIDLPIPIPDFTEEQQADPTANDFTIKVPIPVPAPIEDWYLVLDTTNVGIDTYSIFVGRTRYQPTWLDMFNTGWTRIQE
jgi:hypothetical protein